jgi:predicted Zn-dependent protease
MKKGIWLDVLKLVVLFGALWGIFTFAHLHLPGGKHALTVPISTEEKIGKALTKVVLEENKQYNDSVLDTAMAIITNRLVACIGPTDFNYHFRVLDSRQINAFTLPGANIFVYSKLVEFCNSPDELAAVIAHEIGHAEKRHTIDRLEKELGLTVVFSILTGGNGTVLNEITRTATSTVFDREQEREADDYAFHLLDKAGISPVVFAALFRRINAEQGTNSLDFQILRTHPDNNSRIKAALEYKTSPTFKDRPFDNIDWKRVKASMEDEQDTTGDNTNGQ